MAGAIWRRLGVPRGCQHSEELTTEAYTFYPRPGSIWAWLESPHGSLGDRPGGASQDAVRTAVTTSQATCPECVRSAARRSNNRRIPHKRTHPGPEPDDLPGVRRCYNGSQTPNRTLRRDGSSRCLSGYAVRPDMAPAGIGLLSPGRACLEAEEPFIRARNPSHREGCLAEGGSRRPPPDRT
jgi:hypothetical protein